jgi:DNA-binding HxlR family transcriptional regulator
MKRYGQRCPVARALDVLGERWTPLIVRELLLGPKRYTDLQAALLESAPTSWPAASLTSSRTE